MKIQTRRLHFVLGYIILPILLAISIAGCRETNNSTEVFTKVDPSIEVDLVRFDQLIRSQNNDPIVAFDSLSEKYPGFCDLFRNTLLEARSDEEFLTELEIIHQDTSYENLYEVVQSTFSDNDLLRLHLAQALENYSSVFRIDEQQLPSIYTFISGFTYQAFVFDDGGKEGVGVGLDMYLSSEFPYQKILAKNASFSDYLVRSYNKDHLPKKIIEVLVEDKMPPPSKSDFLHLMIWGGKKLYVMNEILSFLPDTIVLEYTKEQLSWCQSNEFQMWDHFFQKDLFYQTDLRQFSKLIGPAPTSPGMPSESPGRTGNYMGWQVVKAFMRRNPEVTISELLQIRDAQKILDGSKYKPRSS